MSSRIITVVLAVMIGILIPLPAKADLIVHGGTAAQQAGVRHFYESLPECCHLYQICVQLLDNRTMDAYLRAAEGPQADLYCNSTIDGVYQNAIIMVTLRVSLADSDITPTLAHEYGHYVWKRVLSQDQRRRYEQVYHLQRATHHLITPYAAQSVEEGFAETYSYYTRERGCLEKCDALSCHYLQMWLQ